MSNLSGNTTIVVGAGRGIGRGIATAFADAGARVIAVSRTAAMFPHRANSTGSIQSEVADAAEAAAPASLLDRYEPQIVILVAGASPHMRPLQQQTWETFSLHWQTDVRISFHWLREILLKPLRPGSRVVVFSSGAALGGSPLSGGYAGAKSAQRFITAYAQDEAKRAGLDITFTALLPRFSPETGVGRPAVQAYAQRAGQTVEEYLKSVVQSSGPLVTPEIAGAVVVQLVQEDSVNVAPAYMLTGDGLKKLP
jgi:3-oxoacyl-[acyl-carrier protein] reductase